MGKTQGRWKVCICEEQFTVTLKFCILFSSGHNFPCGEKEIDIAGDQTVHHGEKGGFKGLM